MNNYDLSDVHAQQPQGDNVSPYMTYGSGQVLKLNGIELKKSQNTGSSKAILHMETKPIETEGFTPVEGAKGKVGKVGCGVYMNSDALKREFLQKMKTIAVAIGVESEVNKIRSENFEEVVDKIANVLKGKYARYAIVASEYPKDNGKVGITLSLPKFKFVEAENADPSTIVIFDKTNQYHYKKIVADSRGSYGNNAEGATYYAPAAPFAFTPTNGTWETAGEEPVDPATTDLPF